MEAESPFYTTQEVADIFQVHAHTALRWGWQGKVPAYRTPGGRWRYPKKEVDNLWLEQQARREFRSQPSSTSTSGPSEKTSET